MIKLTVSLAFTFYIFLAAAQTTISLEKIATGRIPKEIKFKGNPSEAWKWKDNLGENIIITSVGPSYKAKSFTGDEEEEAYSTELHAFHFIKGDSAYKLLWKISDAVKGCPFDITANFINPVQVTDLDKDDIAETTIQYKLACRSDASPAQMKLIMHEDSVKYALRGSMWLKYSVEMKFTVTEKNVNLETWKDYKGTDDEWEKRYGRYESEKDFILAPPSFLSFARRQWLKYVKESFD